MSRGQEISTQVGGMILAGICLFGVALLAPDAAHQTGAFFKVAAASSWRRLFDLPAAWCSLKIILSSIGLALVIESVGTILARMRHLHLALTIFCLQIVSVLGFLFGSYCLFKALL